MVPPGCPSDDLSSITDFITEARAALVSVGIIREIGSCKFFCNLYLVMLVVGII